MTDSPSKAIWNSTYSMPLAGAGRLLLILDRAGGVAEVSLAVAELLEAAARAGDAHRHVDVGLNLPELLGHRFRDGEDRAGAVALDVAGELGRLTGCGGLGAAAAATRGREERRSQDESGECRQERPGE